jgi:hypothetical protein
MNRSISKSDRIEDLKTFRTICIFYYIFCNESLVANWIILYQFTFQLSDPTSPPTAEDP